MPMPANRPRALTLIELLVVVTIILILVAIGVPFLGSPGIVGDRVKCAKNLRQIGMLIAVNRARTNAPGGQTPADWPLSILGKLDSPEILACPAADEHSPTNPSGQSWAACSYAYLGNLNPTYECTHCDDSEQLWRLYWSGVDYTGGHSDGARSTDDSTFSQANGYRLSDNVVFDKSKVGQGEPPTPTIPDHQDLGYFSPHRPPTERALRQVPDGTDSGPRPLLADIVILTQRPASAGAGPLAWQFANRFITPDEQEAGILFANPCNTSAESKKGWGINVYYSNHAVRWKKWDELRFQVKAPDVVGATSHYYFY